MCMCRIMGKSLTARVYGPTMTATASDNIRVASVGFYVGGSLKCTDTISPYSCAWQVPTSGNRTYQLQAKATDAAGNVGTSALVTVTVK
jgi:hypothetical protein